jgi:hypothetical protein
MARPPKLRKKNGYWMTKAGGCETYFGKVAVVPFKDARLLFLEHLKNTAGHRQKRKAAISSEVLCDLHLDWLQTNRSKDLYKQRQYLLSKWCDFEVGKGANPLRTRRNSFRFQESRHRGLHKDLAKVR